MADLPIDTSVAHSARVWNYWLGGKDNYPADREVGDHIQATFPGIVAAARADRAFLYRAVTHLAGEEGVRQFLDIGTGLPTANNTHEVAQAVAPESTIVYVDNDPLVLTHARALLTSDPRGATHYIDADLGEPGPLLEQAREYLDFDQPVALLIMGTLAHVPGDAEAVSLVRAYVDALCPGSFFVTNDSTNTSPEIVQAADHWNANASSHIHLRAPEQIEHFFDGLELLEPGVVSVPFWRPEPAEVGHTVHVDQYGGLARKP
ncbi:S-adenosyl methyltransferase [Nocardiopsis sp. TSRI0078]|uniref:SAM-dependent methyltransferase n=1 Tax=unclassified Nocardiopsis TaxID=2649073 RepID=UPI000938D7FB|nr:SAM-dependent methyltransferase [Nocardiopsis sp. TSRI0078]OKI21058.1 S-adenosyl methyltransferase [Nocardiopsis sp. TSRI0078]